MANGLANFAAVLDEKVFFFCYKDDTSEHKLTPLSFNVTKIATKFQGCLF